MPLLNLKNGGKERMRRKNLAVAIISMIFCFCLAAGPAFAGGTVGPVSAGSESNANAGAVAIGGNPAAYGGQGVGVGEVGVNVTTGGQTTEVGGQTTTTEVKTGDTKFEQKFESSKPMAIHPNPVQAPSTSLGIGYSGEQRIGPNVCKWGPFKYKKTISKKDIERIKKLRKLKGNVEAFPWNDFPGSVSTFDIVTVKDGTTIEDIDAKYDIIGPIVGNAGEERWVFCDDLYALIADLNHQKIGAPIIIPVDNGFVWGSTTEAGQKSLGAFLSGILGLAGKVALGTTGGITEGSMDVQSHTYPFAVALAVKPKKEPTTVAPIFVPEAEVKKAIAPLPKKEAIVNSNGKRSPKWGESGYESPILRSISPDR